MSARVVLDSESVPRLPRHAKMRFDKAREKWIINAPERVFELDDTAGEVIQLLNGERSLSNVIDSLCERYNQAPRDVIAKDVTEMLQDLADKGFVVA